jgi:hypothetical protein
MSDPAVTVPGMVFEVGVTVWLKVRIGWVQGGISGQVFDFDAWYVTTAPGSTYVASGYQLRTSIGGVEVSDRSRGSMTTARFR